jgi:hypothetical protein
MRSIKYGIFLVYSVAIVCAQILGIWLFVKISIGITTPSYYTVWNEGHSCRTEAYLPDYGRFGFLGKLVSLFSSNGFFRVYSQSGKELRSSEWLLWQREYPELEAAKWLNNRHVIYGTVDGYRGWSLPECAK